jgi:hypothetical protein
MYIVVPIFIVLSVLHLEAMAAAGGSAASSDLTLAFVRHRVS